MTRAALADRPYDVVTVGDCCADLIVSGGDVVPAFGQVEKVVDDYTLELGGSSCLFAAQAARLGLRAAVFGAVGDDPLGRFVRERLAGTGVEVTHVRTLPGLKTGLGVALDRGGDRAILTYPGSIDAVAEPDVPDAFLAAARHLHVGSYYLLRRLRPGVPRLVERAHTLGLTVSLDPNWDPDERWDGGLLDVLPSVDLFLPNCTELLAIANAAGSDSLDERAALARLGRLARCIAVKRGAAGAALWRTSTAGAEKGFGLECRPPAVVAAEVADTVGAGDAFDAGMVLGFLQGWGDAETLRAACACGRATVRAQGGLAGQLDAAGLRTVLEGEARDWVVDALEG